jgi:DNA-binding CsgD family transcriptional regulator
VLDRLRDSGAPEPPELRSLTPQERRILELVAEGLANHQIGEQLSLTAETVKDYASSIWRKLYSGFDDEWPDDGSGVREPRRPAPTGGDTGAAHAGDPF